MDIYDVSANQEYHKPWAVHHLLSASKIAYFMYFSSSVTKVILGNDACRHCVIWWRIKIFFLYLSRLLKVSQVLSWETGKTSFFLLLPWQNESHHLETRQQWTLGKFSLWFEKGGSWLFAFTFCEVMHFHSLITFHIEHYYHAWNKILSSVWLNSAPIVSRYRIAVSPTSDLLCNEDVNVGPNGYPKSVLLCCKLVNPFEFISTPSQAHHALS